MIRNMRTDVLEGGPPEPLARPIHEVRFAQDS